MARRVTDAMIMAIAAGRNAYEGLSWSEDLVTSWQPASGGFVGWVEERHDGETLDGTEISGWEKIKVWVGFEQDVLTYRCASSGCSPAHNVEFAWCDGEEVELRVHDLCSHAIAVAMVIVNADAEWP